MFKHLGEVISLQYGRALSSDSRAGYGYPVYGSNGIVGNHDSALINGPGVIVGRKGSVGKVAWSSTSFWPIDTTYYIEAKNCNISWAYRVLDWLPLQSLDTSTGIPGLNRNDVYELSVFFPEEKEQSLIARILDTLDAQIEKTEALIAKLEKVKEGLLHDLLTRGIDENGQLRPSPEQAPELYKESPLGLIPREWSVGSLGDLSEIVSGVTLGGKSGSSAWPLVPYLRVANVQDGYLNLADIKLIRVSPADIEKYRLLPGDVLMNEGGDFDKLGRGALWQGQIDICLHQNHVFRVRTTPGVLSPHFLAAFSSSASGKRYFIRSSKQSTNLASINSTQLKAFQVPLPSSDEQNLIVKELQAMASKIESEKVLLDKMITQKSGLMDDLLTGRIRVTPLLEQAQETTSA